MGRLTGFRYREIVKRLKKFGFVFDRQAAGSHEIWFNPGTSRYTTIPNHPGDMPEGHPAGHPQTSRHQPGCVPAGALNKPLAPPRPRDKTGGQLNNSHARSLTVSWAQGRSTDAHWSIRNLHVQPATYRTDRL